MVFPLTAYARSSTGLGMIGPSVGPTIEINASLVWPSLLSVTLTLNESDTGGLGGSYGTCEVVPSVFVVNGALLPSPVTP